jgi:hypothetical protein
MPVTIALYDCMGCSHCKGCPDYSDDRRFGWNGAQLLPGAGSIRCHHAQHDRRKDYSVDLFDGIRLRELLNRFGFIDIGHDDGCLNRCRECAHTDCELHPYHNRSKGFMAQAREAARNGYRQFNEFNKQMREVERAMRSSREKHKTGRAADFTSTQQAYAKSDARFTRGVYTDLRGYDIAFGDTIEIPIDRSKTAGRYPYMHAQPHIRDGRFMDGYRKYLGLL